MAIKIPMEIKAKFDVDGEEEISNNMQKLDKEISQATDGGVKNTLLMEKSLLKMLQLSYKLVTSFSSVEFSFNDSVFTNLQSGITNAIRDGMNDALKNLSTTSQNALNNASGTGAASNSAPNGSTSLKAQNGVVSLEQVVLKLEKTISSLNISLARQSNMRGQQTMAEVERMTGRPQTTPYQELGELNLRMQGKEIRRTAQETLQLLATAENELEDTKDVVKKLVGNLRTKLDFTSLEKYTSEIAEQFIQTPPDLATPLNKALFGSISNSVNIEGLADVDNIFETLVKEFDIVSKQGVNGISALRDAQGKWLSQTLEGQKLIASTLIRFLNSSEKLQGSPSAELITGISRSASAGKLDADVINNSGKSEEEKTEALELYNTLLGIVQAYEKIEDSKERMNLLSSEDTDRQAGLLQRQEKLLAINRDQLSLAKDLNALSTRYSTILDQNNNLLKSSSDATNIAIATNDYGQLALLARQYGNNVQRSINLEKQLQNVIERNRNLAKGYLGQLQTSANSMTNDYRKALPLIGEVLKKTTQIDMARTGASKDPVFAPAIEAIKKSIDGIGAELSPFFEAEVLEMIKAGTIDGNVANSFADSLQKVILIAGKDPKIAAGLAALGDGLSNGLSSLFDTIEGRSDVTQGVFSGEQIEVLRGLTSDFKKNSNVVNENSASFIKYAQGQEQAVEMQKKVSKSAAEVGEALKRVRSALRVSDEGLRVVERVQRQVTRNQFQFNKVLTEGESIFSELGDNNTLLSIDTLDRAKSFLTSMKGAAREASSFRAELAEAKKLGFKDIANQERIAIEGGPSQFSGAGVGLEGQARQDAIKKAASEAKAALEEYYRIVEKGEGEQEGFGQKAESVLDMYGKNYRKLASEIQRRSLVQGLIEGTQNAERKINELSMEFLSFNSISNKSLNDLQYKAQVLKQFGQDAQTMDREIRKLNSRLLFLRTELTKMPSSSDGFKALQNQIKETGAELTMLQAQATRFASSKFDPNNRQTSFRGDLATRATQGADKAFTLNTDIIAQDISRLKQDFKSLDVNLLASAINDFQALKNELSSTSTLIQKSLRDFDALKESGQQLDAEDIKLIENLRMRQKETNELLTTMKLMEQQQKTAQNTLNYLNTSWRDYSNQIGQAIRSQLDFATGAGMIAATGAAISTSFREVLGDAKNLTRAFTVLQSSQKSMADVMTISSDAIRNASSRFGLSVAQTADVAKEIGSAGISMEDTLRALVPTLKAINSTGAETTQVTRAVAGIYNVFKDDLKAAGKEMQEFEVISDTLVSVHRNHQAELDELVQGYKFVIGTGRAAGFGFQDLGGYLAVLNDNMIKSGMAGRGLQTVIAQIAAKGPQLKSMFGVDLKANLPIADQFNDILKQMNKGISQGSISAEELNKVFQIFDREGARAFVTLAQQYPNVEKALNRIKNESQGVNDQLSALVSNSLDRRFYQMKQAALNLVRDGLDKIKPALIEIFTFAKGMFIFVQNLNSATGGLVVKIGTLVASTAALGQIVKVLAAASNFAFFDGLQNANKIAGSLADKLNTIANVANKGTDAKNKALEMKELADKTKEAAEGAREFNTSITDGVRNYKNMDDKGKKGLRLDAMKAIAMSGALVISAAVIGTIVSEFSRLASLSEDYANDLDTSNAALAETKNSLKNIRESQEALSKMEINLGTVGFDLDSNGDRLGAQLRKVIETMGDEAVASTGVQMKSNQELAESYNGLRYTMAENLKLKEKELELIEKAKKAEIERIKILKMGADLGDKGLKEKMTGELTDGQALLAIVGTPLIQLFGSLTEEQKKYAASLSITEKMALKTVNTMSGLSRVMSGNMDFEILGGLSGRNSGGILELDNLELAVMEQESLLKKVKRSREIAAKDKSNGLVGSGNAWIRSVIGADPATIERELKDVNKKIEDGRTALQASLVAKAQEKGVDIYDTDKMKEIRKIVAEQAVQAGLFTRDMKEAEKFISAISFNKDIKLNIPGSEIDRINGVLANQVVSELQLINGPLGGSTLEDQLKRAYASQEKTPQDLVIDKIVENAVDANKVVIQEFENLIDQLKREAFEFDLTDLIKLKGNTVQAARNTAMQLMNETGKALNNYRPSDIAGGATSIMPEFQAEEYINTIITSLDSMPKNKRDETRERLAKILNLGETFSSLEIDSSDVNVKNKARTNQKDALKSALFSESETQGVQSYTLSIQSLMQAYEVLNLNTVNLQSDNATLFSSFAQLAQGLGETERRFMDAIATSQQFKDSLNEMAAASDRARERNSQMQKSYGIRKATDTAVIAGSTVDRANKELLNQVGISRISTFLPKEIKNDEKKLKEWEDKITGLQVTNSRTAKEALKQFQDIGGAVAANNAFLGKGIDLIKATKKELQGMIGEDAGNALVAGASSFLNFLKVPPETQELVDQILATGRATTGEAQDQFAEARKLAREKEVQRIQETKALKESIYLYKQENKVAMGGVAEASSKLRLLEDQYKIQERQLKIERMIVRRSGNYGEADVAGLNQLIEAQRNALTQARALRNEFETQTVSLFDTLATGNSMLAIKPFREIVNISGELISSQTKLSFIQEKINKVNIDYADDEVSRQDAIIRLYAEKMKLLKTQQEQMEKIQELLNEPMVTDRRPEIFKEGVASIKEISASYNGLNTKTFDKLFDSRKAQMSLAIAQAMGISIEDAAQSGKELKDQFIKMAIEGRVNFDLIPQSLRVALKEQNKLYQEQRKFEDAANKSVLRRVELTKKRIDNAFLKGDIKQADQLFGTLLSDVTTIGKAFEGNQAGYLSFIKDLDIINESLLEAEKGAKNELSLQLQLNGIDDFEAKGARFRAEIQRMVDDLNVFTGGNYNFQLEESLAGKGLFREQKQVDVMESTIKRIETSMDKLIDELRKLKVVSWEKGNPNFTSSDANPTVKAIETYVDEKNMVTMEEIRKLPNIIKGIVNSDAQNYSKDAKDALTKGFDKIIQGDKVNGKRTARNIAKEIQRNQIADATNPQRKQIEATQFNSEKAQEMSVELRRLQEKLDRVNATFSNSQQGFNSIAREEGASRIARGLSSNNLREASISVMAKAMPMFADGLKTVVGMMPGFVSNIEFAKQNASAFENFLVSIKGIRQEFANTFNEIDTGLKRNQTNYYDYINSIQDAEKDRYFQIRSAEEEYQNALAKTDVVFTDNVLNPLFEAIPSLDVTSILDGILSDGGLNTAFGDNINQILGANLFGGKQAALSKEQTMLQTKLEELRTTTETGANKVVEEIRNSASQSKMGGFLGQGGAFGGSSSGSSGGGGGGMAQGLLGAGTSLGGFDLGESGGPASARDSILQGAAGIAAGALTGFAGIAFTGFGQIVSSAFSAATSQQSEYFERFLDKYSNELPLKLEGIITRFTENFPMLVEKLIGMIPTIANSLSKVLPKMVSTLVITLTESMGTYFENMSEALPKVATAIVTGLTNAMMSKDFWWGLLTGMVQMVVAPIKAGVFMLGINDGKKAKDMSAGDIAKSLLTSTAVGAGIGALVGGPVGALIGGGVGLVGGIGGLIFHRGGIVPGSSPKEVPATLLSGEGVLNRNAMNFLGRDQLKAINSGDYSKFMNSVSANNPNSQKFSSLADSNYGRRNMTKVDNYNSKTQNTENRSINVGDIILNGEAPRTRREAEMLSNELVGALDRRLAKGQKNRTSYMG